MPRALLVLAILSLPALASAQDAPLETRCRETAAPDIGLLRDCILFAAVTGRERATVVARYAATAAHEDSVPALSAVAIARQPVVRNAVARALVHLGALSAAAAARIPTFSQAWREMARLLRPLHLAPTMLCCPEDLIVLREAPRGSLHVGSTSNYCADGLFLASHFTIDDDGWHLVSAAASDTGPP